MPPIHVRLITLDPGHFHAALVQKQMYPGVDAQAHVYAPLGPDLIVHLQRLTGFNARPDRPTAWRIEAHAGPDFLDRMIREKPGNVVVLSGRNRHKIDYLLASVQAGLNVLADKPWIIVPEDLPQLEAALDTAERNGLVAYDIMTERFEITSLLQRELVNDRELFGEPVAGHAEQPGVFMESKHYLMKTVAGVPLRRPAWFFDVGQQGEGLTDVGTHLVDLVPWVLFPGQAIDHRRDVEMRNAARWPTVLTRDDFRRVTGEADFPDFLRPQLVDGRLPYFCNTRVDYFVRGVQVRLNVLWDFEAATGAGDTHYALFRGSRAAIEVRQGAEEDYRPELYVVPNRAGDARVSAALRRKVAELQGNYPGVEVQDRGGRLGLAIPDRYRVGHEAHFAEVTRAFLGYLQEPASMPAWEKANMLAKYYITTHGVELARRGTPIQPS